MTAKIEVAKPDKSNTLIEAKQGLNPTLILLLVLFVSSIMTYFVDSGRFQRTESKVIPGSYRVIQKSASIEDIFNLNVRSNKKEDSNLIEKEARPVSIFETFLAIPRGIEKQAGLIFMVLFIGGMFGVLNKSGAIEAGLGKILSLTRGNIYILVPSLMIIFSAGSTFIGLAKEYILIVPFVVALAKKMKFDNLIGLAIVAIPIKLGYLSSVTNPIVLPIAQPLVNLPVFSGIPMRAATYFVLLLIGIVFVLRAMQKQTVEEPEIINFEFEKISIRNTISLFVLLFGVAFMVYASINWKWKYQELAAYYLFLSMLFGVISGFSANQVVDAFLSGMNKVLIAGLLIGLATAVEIILNTGQVLDTIVNALASSIGNHGPIASAFGMFMSSLAIDVVIPSTSGQAAITMPIFGPLGQLTGVSPQSTVYAFLLGHGLTNFITPTSSGLLVLLATAEVSWSKWAKFILPLFGIYFLTCCLLLGIAIAIAY